MSTSSGNIYLMKIGVGAKMNKEEAERLLALLNDLGWEYQRMSTSGQTTLNEIYAMVGIEPMEDDRHLDVDYMMKKVEGKDD